MHPAHLQRPDVATALEAPRFDVDAYDLAWQDYLTCGGFPRAVAEHHRTGAVSHAYLRDLAAWLHRDVDPDAPAESVPLLLDGLVARACSPLNITIAAADLGYSNYKVFGRRLERLGVSFAGLGAHRVKTPGVSSPAARRSSTSPTRCWPGSRRPCGPGWPPLT